MTKPEIHAEHDSKRFGGKPCDYLPIHNWFDSSKSFMASSQHRAILHHSFGIFLAERTFGINYTLLDKLAEKHGWTKEEISDILTWKEECNNSGASIKNSDGKTVSVRDVGESHCLSDFGGKFIPTPQDYLEEMPLKGWMNNGSGQSPSSFRKIEEDRKEKTKTFYLT